MIERKRKYSYLSDEYMYLYIHFIQNTMVYYPIYSSLYKLKPIYKNTHNIQCMGIRDDLFKIFRSNNEKSMLLLILEEGFSFSNITNSTEHVMKYYLSHFNYSKYIIDLYKKLIIIKNEPIEQTELIERINESYRIQETLSLI